MPSSQNTSNKDTSHLNSLVAAGTSGLAGAYASFFFEGTKKRLQSNQSLPNPMKSGAKIWFKESFRGSGSFAGSLVPTSIIQRMTSHYFEEKNLSNTFAGKAAETISSGALGGLASTVVENMVLEQQLKKVGPKDAFMSLIGQGYTRIYRGLPVIMAREAIFGVCYLKGADEAGKYATANFGAAYDIPARLTVGVLGSLASHPLDTIATTMQHQGYANVSDAVAHLRKENGIKAFYKGGAARIGLFTTAMLVISKTNEVVSDKLNEITATAPEFK